MSTKLIVELDIKLDSDFRKAILKKYGFKKGNIKLATEEALQNMNSESGGNFG